MIDQPAIPDLSRFEVRSKRARPSGDTTVPAIIDEELAKLGWSETARLSLLGDVGRENAWNRQTIFAGHSDPANKAFNRGIISWQGVRRTKLDNYLKQEGVLGRADDDELRAMTRFLDKELREDYPSVYRQLQNADTTFIASEALRKYIEYSPKAPYNSYDKDFRVKNNRQWAEKARQLGLAQPVGAVPDLSEFELTSDLPDLTAYELASFDAPRSDLSDLVPPIAARVDVPQQIAVRPRLLPRGRAAEPVIGPSEEDYGQMVADGVYVKDHTVIGREEDPNVPANLLPRQGSVLQSVTVEFPEGITDPQARRRYTAEKAARTVAGEFGLDPQQTIALAERLASYTKLSNAENSAGDSYNISRETIDAIKGSGSVDAMLRERTAQARPFLADTAITRDEINRVAGWETRLPTFIDEGAGHTSEYVAGLTRLLSPEFLAGTENLKGTVRAYAPNEIYPYLKEHGRLTRSNAEFFDDGSFSTEVLRMGGNLTSDLPRTIAQTALPGGIITASAVDAAAQSAGRGEQPGQIRNSALKGAIMGAIARTALPVGKGLAANTGSRLAGGVGALAYTGAATYPTARAFGASPEQAVKETIYNTAFAVGDAALASMPDLKAYESTPTHTAASATPKEVAQVVKASTPDIEVALGTPKERTARNLRANLAESARSFDRAHDALKQARDVFAKQSPADNFDFIHKFEKMLPEDSWTPSPKAGAQTVFPEGQLEIATTLRGMLDEARDRVRSLGVGALDRYYTNYFPHLFEKPTEVQAFLDKQLSGTKGFLKPRAFPTFREALDAGFKPISTNPVDLALIRINDLNTYAAGQKTVKFLRENHYIKQIKTGAIPDGFVKLPENIAGPDQYAVPGAANILKNFVSPSLHRYKAFRAYRTLGNFMTQANLSFSLFHLGNVVLDSVTSKLALGIEQLATGQPLRAGRSAVEALTPGYTTIQNLIQGDKVLKEWLTPGSTNDPAMSKIAELLTEAGGRAGMDESWHTRMARQFADHVKQDEYFKAAFKATPALLDKMSQPVMQYLVPRMKLSAFLQLAQQELHRLGPDAHPEVVRESMQRAWDSVENRLGEATMSNYFWNRTVKDLGMASFQSLGWQLGALREFGGAVKDTVTAPKRLASALKGQQQATPVVTHRMAYVPAVVMSTGLYGAMVQYLLTGEPPESVRDLFFPRDGRRDEKGRPARVNLPTFLKDVYAVSNAPLSTASHKLHPLPRLLTQLATNQDYFSNEIRDTEDPATKQLADAAKHAAGAFLPYSVKGAQQNIKRGAGTRDTLLPFIGLAPAPKSINDPWTPAENIVRDFNRQLLGPRTLIRTISDSIGAATTKNSSSTPEQNSPMAAILKRQYIEEVKAGQNLNEELQMAVKVGILTPNDIAEITHTAHNYLREGVTPMTLDQAITVYEAANTKERELLYRSMQAKIGDNIERLTSEQIRKLKHLDLY